ncbi:MAG: hypothetical protein ACFFD2_06985 [Promethearchaeota archaeon]
MVECKVCGQEMKNAESCTMEKLFINGKWYRRNTTYFDQGKRCHDCGIMNKQGNFHHLGCDIERCPCCGLQLISCGCNVDELKIFK